jgi:hypothetical protein
MKRIALLLAILFATHMAFAQEEVAIEQNINTSISYLNINAGWNVHLMHRETEGYRIAIVVPKQYEEIAIVDVHVCNINCDTMTINENALLPRGTIIELEGPMTFGQINLLNNATAEADYVVASAASVSEKETNLHLGKNASLLVKHYHIPSKENSPVMDVWDQARLTIDTISGEGDAVVNVFAGADFQYGINALHGKITLSEYDKTSNWPNWPYQQKDVRIIKTKEVDGKLVTTDRRKIWNDALALDGGIGILQGNTPTDPNSPLLQSTTLSVKLGMTTYFKFSNHWGLSSGILWNHNTKSLCHQVKYEDEELVVIDGQGDYQRDRLKNDYLGIPITLFYYLGKRQTESLSLDLYCARLLGERLSTSADPTQAAWGFGWTAISVDNVFNPWKLEAGLSFNTQHLGVIHGIRVFTNLLPEYKPGFTTEKIRSVGIEIKL